MKTKAVKTKQLRDNLTRPYPAPLSSRAEELVKQAKLIPARGEPVECPESPVKLPAGTAAQYLDADRDEPYGSSPRDNLIALGVPHA